MAASVMPRVNRWFDLVPRVAAVISAGVGALVLVGWALGVDELRRVAPGLPAMKANTAAAFIVSGVALLGAASRSERRPLRIATRICAAVVMLLGLLTALEYPSGSDLGLDQLFVREEGALPGDFPGRMSLATSISFAAVGAGLLLQGRGRRLMVPIHFLAGIPLFLGGSTLIGYGYDFDEFLRQKLIHTPMALHTAVVFVLLGFSLVTLRADYPFRRLAASANPAGVMLRRLLPAAVVLTLLIGWPIKLGYEAGYLSETAGLAVFAAAMIAGLAAMILWNAGALYDAAVRRERAEDELRAASRYARSLIEVSLDPLVTISAKGKITDVNEATVRATGVSREQLLGSDFSDYFTEPDKARASYREVFAKGFVTDYPLTVRHVSGRVTEVLYNASVYRNGSGEIAGVFAAARDITERRKLEQELERQAHIDPLTELNSRRHFMELAEQAMARARRHDEPLSLLMLDLDHFKRVNDTHGHQAGDTVLQNLGEVCRRTFREMDIVGRLGGEEFAALLPETGAQQALEVAERLRVAVERSGVRLENGTELHLTISIGVAPVAASDTQLNSVLKRADAALYRAKSGGRNRVSLEQGA